MTNRQDFLRNYIKDHVIRTKDELPIFSPGGRPSSWIFDFRPALMDALFLDALAEEFWDRYETKFPFQIGGLEVAAIPLITGLIMKGKERGIDARGFFVRKSRKKHGLCRFIEGELTGDPIIIVDDLLNSGKSQRRIQMALDEEGRKIDEVFVIVNYGNPYVQEEYKEQGIGFGCLFTLDEFDRTMNYERPEQKNRFEPVWVFDPGIANQSMSVPKSTPVLDDEKLYYGVDFESALYALDIKTGNVAWKFQCGKHYKGIYSSPALHDGVVFVGSYDGSLYAIHTDTGALKWQYDGADYIGSSPCIAADIGLVFIGLEHALPNRQGSIVALDIETGEQKWEYTVKEFLHGTPGYFPQKGVVGIGTNDDIFFLFRADSGRLLWQFQTGGDIKLAPAFDAERNLVIFNSFDKHCYAVDMDSGKKVWSFETEAGTYTTPLVVGNKVFVTCLDKKCYIYDMDAQEVIKTIHGAARIMSCPRLIDGKVFYGDNEGMLRMIDPETLAVENPAQVLERINGAVTKSDVTGYYYIRTSANQMVAFRAPS